MGTFIGRKQELQFLERMYSSPSSEFVPIYGRRRIGKSELILEFIKDKPAVYFSGKRAPEDIQVQEYLTVAAQSINEPLLAATSIHHWQEALEQVVEQWKGSEKLVIVLDEFQWIAESATALTSYLQEIWDRKWRDLGYVMLILCGSYVGFMEREVLGAKSPLFGRRSGQILLGPFDYREARSFHPAYSTVDSARTYFICGGIPYYLQCFDESISVDENIINNLLSQFAALFREPDFLLREELREVEKYTAILYALGARALTRAELVKMTAIPNGSFGYYKDHMVNLGYLAAHQSLSTNRRKRPKVHYRIKDPLLRFWFTFVYPNQSQLARVGPRKLYVDRIKSELPRYFGGSFEQLCQQALSHLYLKEGISADFEVGEYWDKSVQVDVIGLRQDNWVDLCECKWGKLRSLKQIIEEVERKVRAYPNHDNATIGRRVFSRQKPPRGKLPALWSWHTLEDLYNL